MKIIKLYRRELFILTSFYFVVMSPILLFINGEELVKIILYYLFFVGFFGLIVIGIRKESEQNFDRFMSAISAIEQFHDDLLRVISQDKASFQGCSSEELVGLMKKHDVTTLPLSYKAILQTIGHGSPFLETEVKFFYDDLLQLKEAAVEVASKAHWIPESDIFVFMEYKGDYYAFPTTDDIPCIVMFGSTLPIIINENLNNFLGEILKSLQDTKPKDLGDI